MKSVKYTIIGAVIGLSLGGLLSIGVVGSHSACEGVNGCFGCIKMCSGGCGGCLSWWITPVKPFLYGCCGCFGITCDDGCIYDWSCTDGCDGGCFNGCDNGLDECNKGCGNCGYSKCTQGCTECSNGCESDCDHTQEELSNDPDAKKKIKNYLMYLTIIGTVIGAVFGIVCDIQDKERKRREAEEAERKRKQKIEEDEKRRLQEAEERERRLQQETEERERKRQQEAEEKERKRKQLAEDKWQEMRAWLSK